MEEEEVDITDILAVLDCRLLECHNTKTLLKQLNRGENIMASLTRQDIQAVIDNARSRMLDYVASRQDMHALQETTRTLTITLQQSQHLLRHEERQRTELIRRSVALEGRMSQLEHEIHDIRRTVTMLANHHPTQKITERVIVARPEERQRYAYTSA